MIREAGAARLLISYSHRRGYCPASRGHSSQVLRRCRQQEFVVRTAFSSQLQSIEFQYSLEVGKPTRSLLRWAAWVRIGGRFAYSTRHIARILIDAAGNLAMRGVRAAVLLE